MNNKKINLRSVEEIEVRDVSVIVRVDWNVTIGKALQIVDDTRIVRTLPTIELLLSKGAKKIVLLAHLGKTGENRSLGEVVKYASKILGRKIEFCLTIEEARHTDSKIVMLENLRMWAGEDLNEVKFAQKLSTLGDVYVNEAFGECHRESASIVGLPTILPAYAGLWLREEVEAIMSVRDNPAHPYVVVMGGAKVEDKLPLLRQLAQKADIILVGGRLANELQGENTKLKGTANVILPVEPAYAKAMAGEGEYLDIGEETQKIFAEKIARAKTIVWNGPMGKVEDMRYRAGTQAVFEAIVSNEEAYTLVGGGDTLAAVGREEQIARIDHVSTGGGAMLALLEQGDLVGLQLLKS